MLEHLAILDLSTPDLAIILLIVLLLFGGKKLPELSRSLGASVREAKKSLNEMQGLKDDLHKQVGETKASLQQGGQTRAGGEQNENRETEA
ncbi:MAG TPA: twin-arginine translocase TatA/TatE family subunit [Verrucomicrobiae bacterium]|nr:twin-arginine translocase TatA/TatE family subunit [Verrucomicrobiae bacterium]